MTNELHEKHINSSDKPKEDAPVSAAGHERVAEDVRKPSNPKLIIVLIVVGATTVGLLAAAGFAAYHSMWQPKDDLRAPNYVGGSMMRMRGGSGFGYGQTVRTEVNNGEVTTTVYKYVTGVVTEVSGDNLTIAGNGKKTTVKTNSSTSYVGNVKPAVNDTVTIAGTTDNSTVTATEVSVANNG